jgi:hypothetical protein
MTYVWLGVFIGVCVLLMVWWVWLVEYRGDSEAERD